MRRVPSIYLQEQMMRRTQRPSRGATWGWLFAGLMLVGSLACNRDLLVGSDLHPTMGGTTGTGGSGGTGGSPMSCETSGMAGIGVAPPRCTAISTGLGMINPCGRTSGIAYSPDGQLLATATNTPQPNVHIWRLSDGTLLEDLPGHGNNYGSFSVAFSPDGTILATAGGVPDCTGPDPTKNDPSVVKLWNVSTGALLRLIPADTGGYAATAEFSHDGTRLVTGGMLGSVQIWNVADGSLVATIPTGYTTYNARFSPDDTRVVNAGIAHGGVWSAVDGSAIFPITGLENEMNDAAYSPDGRLIVTTGDGLRLQFFDANGSLLQSFVAQNVNYMSRAVWVDNVHVVSDDWGGNVKSWTRDATGTFVASGAWSLGSQTLGMSVSPDKKRLAIAMDAGFVFIAYQPSDP